MSIILEERIKQCLYCPICHKTLRLFFASNKVWEKPSKRVSLTETDSKVIVKLGNLLLLSGSVEEQWEILYNLTQSPKTKGRNKERMGGAEENEMDCFYILNRILFELRSLYTVPSDRDSKFFAEQILRKISKASYTILQEIYNLECKINSEGDQIAQQKASHANLNKWFNTISEFKVSGTLSRCFSKHTIPEKEYILASKELGDLLKRYCQLNIKGMPTLSYRYCSNKYINRLKGDFKDKFIDCQAAYFLTISEQIPSPKSKASLIGTTSLANNTSPFAEIYEEYLRYAPKHFGNNLKKVMEIQGVEIKDVSSLMETKSPNEISALCGCRTPNRNKQYIHRLARCLLVSDEVLVSGTGKSYGTWKDVLSPDGLNTIKEHIGSRTPKSTEIWTRNQIRDWVNLSDCDFEKLMIDNSEFFLEEPFCAYEIKEDGEIFLDYPSMVKNLLHPEEFEVLKQVLENQKDQ